jgi:hypothetical protein
MTSRGRIQTAARRELLLHGETTTRDVADRAYGGRRCSKGDVCSRRLRHASFGRQILQAFVLNLPPTIFDCHVSTFDIAAFTQTLAECR